MIFRHRKKNRDRIKHIRKQLYIAIICVLIAFFVTQITLYYLSNYGFRFIVPKLVQTISGGLYNVSFKGIKIDFTSRGVIMEDFHLKPDTSLYHKLQNENRIQSALYDISFPKLEIFGISSYQFIFDNAVHINTIRLLNPVTKLIGLPKRFKPEYNKRYDAANKDLFPFLNKYLNAIEVDLMHLDEGYFDLFIQPNAKTKTTIADNLSLYLHNFNLNSQNFNTKKKHLFYSENIDFIIHDYFLLLNDSIHSVKAKKILLSTEKKKILADSVSMLPIQVDRKNLDDLEKDFFQLEIPNIEIEGINFDETFYNKDLHISNIHFKNPEIKYFSKKRKRKNIGDPLTLRESAAVNLYPLIKGNLSSVMLDKLTLSNSSLQWFHTYSDSKPVFSADELSVILMNFNLDSISNERFDKIFYADNLDLRLNNLNMQLADNRHTLKTKELIISTPKSKIYANNFELFPNNKSTINQSNTNITTYEIFVPHLNISNIDLVTAYNFRKLPVKSLNVIEPMLNIRSFVKNSKKGAAKDKNFYEILKNYLVAVDIESLKVQNGLFNISSVNDSLGTTNTNGKVNLKLKDLLIDSSTILNSKQLFYAKEIDFRFENYALKLPDNIHLLEINNFNASSIEKKVELNEFVLRPVFDEQFYQKQQQAEKLNVTDIFIEKIVLKNADISQIYYDKTADIKGVYIDNPRLNITKIPTGAKETTEKKNEQLGNLFYQFILGDTSVIKDLSDGLRNYVKIVDIEELQINDGRFEFINSTAKGNHSYHESETDFSLDLQNFNFHIDSIRQNRQFLFSDNILLILRNERFNLPNNDYIILTDSVILSSQSKSLTAYGLQINPPSNTSHEKFFELDMNTLNINNLDLQKFKNEKFILLDTIVLKEPRIISHNYSGSINKQSSAPKITINLPDYIHKIDVNTLIIDQGDFTQYKGDEKNQNKILSSKINCKLETFNFDSVVYISHNNRFLNFSHSDVELNNFEIKFADSLHRIHADRITYNSESPHLHGHDIDVYVTKKNESLIKSLLQKNLKATILDLHFRKIMIQNPDFDKLINSRDIYIPHAEVFEPSLSIIHYPKLKPSNKLQFQLERFNNQLQRNFNSLKIKNIKFNTGTLHYMTKNNNDTNNYTFDNFSGSLNNFHIDQLNSYDPNNFYNSDDISLEIKNKKINLPDTNYKCHVNRVSASTGQKNLKIGGIHIEPKTSIYDLANSFNFQKGIIDIKAEELIFEGLDYFNLIEEKSFTTTKTSFDDFILRVYNNKKLPYDHNRRPPDFQDYYQKLKKYIKTDTIELDNSMIIYEEMPVIGNKTGIFTIEDIDALIVLPKNEDNPGNVVVNAAGEIMGAGHLEAILKFPVNQNKHGFHLEGKIDTIELYVLNSYLENNMFLSIKDGTVSKSEFYIESEDQVATGKMKIYYNDLKISLLNKDLAKSIKGINSFVANSIIRNDNPGGTFRPLRIGYMHHKKDKSKTIFQHIVTTLTTGIKSTMGFNTKEIKEDIKAERKKDE